MDSSFLNKLEVLEEEVFCKPIDCVLMAFQTFLKQPEEPDAFFEITATEPESDDVYLIFSTGKSAKLVKKIMEDFKND